METPRSTARTGETAGFVAAFAFVCFASVRDVYLGGLFQRLSPLTVAIVAFTLCSVVFVPIALVRNPHGLRTVLRHPAKLFWVNATSAVAWISFFYALRMTEPLIVQILFSGIGPLSVVWIDRWLPGGRLARPASAENSAHVGLIVALGLATAVTLTGLSGTGAQPFGTAALAVLLAAGAGVSISINTVLCRQLNDAGVDPPALVGVRFIGAAVAAAGLAWLTRDDSLVRAPAGAVGLVAGVSLLLIVGPIYVNQIAISLASPLTVRVVQALAPLVIFVLQLVEGRLILSPYSFASAVLYGIAAMATALTRRRAIRAAAIA